MSEHTGMGNIMVEQIIFQRLLFVGSENEGWMHNEYRLGNVGG